MNISKFTSTDYNIKRRKKRKKTLLDHTNFISGNIKYMDLVPQPKQFCFYKILFISPPHHRHHRYPSMKKHAVSSVISYSFFPLSFLFFPICGNVIFTPSTSFTSQTKKQQNKNRYYTGSHKHYRNRFYKPVQCIFQIYFLLRSRYSQLCPLVPTRNYFFPPSSELLLPLTLCIRLSFDLIRCLFC